jgi:hypothetical protein
MCMRAPTITYVSHALFFVTPTTTPRHAAATPQKREERVVVSRKKSVRQVRNSKRKVKKKRKTNDDDGGLNCHVIHLILVVHHHPIELKYLSQIATMANASIHDNDETCYRMMTPTTTAPPSKNKNRTLPGDDDRTSTMAAALDYDCLLHVLEFLSWEDLNSFAMTCRLGREIREDPWLDQTRCGTIRIEKSPQKKTTAVSIAKSNNTMEFMDKIRERKWSEAFCGQRTHLRLLNLLDLCSSDDQIDFNRIATLKEVTSLDCSMTPDQKQRLKAAQTGFSEYIDKAFSIGLALSLIVPNLKNLDISRLPLTSISVGWLAETLPLKTLCWKKAFVWPINNESCEHIRALQHIENLSLDESRLIFSKEDLLPSVLWSCLADHNRNLRRLSIRKVKWLRHSRFHPLPQTALMRLVRCIPNLEWFRSDLTRENVEILQKERPNVTFCN